MPINMEIVAVSENSIKLKTKNTSIVINPQGKIDSDVVVFTQKPDDYSPYEGKIVIDGPGEYETAGVSIKADNHSGKIYFDFIEDNQRFLLLTSVDSIKDKEMENYNAVLVLLDKKIDGELSSLTSDVVSVIGSEEFIADKESVKKVDKINLKKTDELKGLLVHLSK